MEVETFFKNIDYAKHLLFNSATEAQEKTAREVLNKFEQLGKKIMIGG